MILRMHLVCRCAHSIDGSITMGNGIGTQWTGSTTIEGTSSTVKRRNEAEEERAPVQPQVTVQLRRSHRKISMAIEPSYYVYVDQQCRDVDNLYYVHTRALYVYSVTMLRFGHVFDMR